VAGNQAPPNVKRPDARQAQIKLLSAVIRQPLIQIDDILRAEYAGRLFQPEGVHYVVEARLAWSRCLENSVPCACTTSTMLRVPTSAPTVLASSELCADLMA